MGKAWVAPLRHQRKEHIVEPDQRSTTEKQGKATSEHGEVHDQDPRDLQRRERQLGCYGALPEASQTRAVRQAHRDPGDICEIERADSNGGSDKKFHSCSVDGCRLTLAVMTRRARIRLLFVDWRDRIRGKIPGHNHRGRLVSTTLPSPGSNKQLSACARTILFTPTNFRDSMKVINASIVVSTLFALAACQPESIAGSPDASPSMPVSLAAGTALPNALPQGFELGFPYHYTQVEVVPGRKQRQRITVEFLEGDVASTAGSLANGAVAAGFTRGIWGVQKDGSIHFVADKPGYGQMRAHITSAVGKSLENPAAKGELVMGWPVRPADPIPAGP
jgi:hypothetical protein